MYKKKEIIIIIIIIAVTITLAFLPSMLKNRSTKEVEITTTPDSMIEIRVEGEVNKEDITLSVPKGTSYGYILQKIRIYLNSYSIVESDFKKCYYEDTVITVESTDTGALVESEVSVSEDSGKIRISEASKDILVSLYGIGEKRAETIIEYRESHEIDSWETLKNLLGVSDEVIKSIQEKAVL